MVEIVGIDLGTTNSALAYLDPDGRPIILENQEGERITPSAVAVNNDHVIVGTEALRMQTSGSGDVVTGFKRDMGTDKVYTLGGNEHTPIELSTFVLKKLTDYAAKQLGTLGDVVITTPANRSHEFRVATKSAGEIAGLSLAPEIEEPTAAAIYYAQQEELQPGVYFVYDFGGGTWDITAVEISSTEVNVLSNEGISECGGRDFDESLKELIHELYFNETGEGMDDRLQKFEYEDIKKSLGVRETYDNLYIRQSSGPPVHLTVTREQFEAKISALIASTEICCEEILEKYPEFIDVLLVGGSTRVPMIQKSVEKVFGKAPKTLGNPDEVVALGAAIYAGKNANPSDLNANQTQLLSRTELNQVASHYFGIQAVIDVKERGSREIRNVIIIKKGEPVPCSVTEPFQTTDVGQTAVELKVTESHRDETDIVYVDVIWEGELEVPPGRPAGQKIEVTFAYTVDQIMKCSFVDVASGLKKVIDLEVGSAASPEDRKNIDKFLLE